MGGLGSYANLVSVLDLGQEHVGWQRSRGPSSTRVRGTFTY